MLKPSHINLIVQPPELVRQMLLTPTCVNCQMSSVFLLFFVIYLFTDITLL